MSIRTTRAAARADPAERERSLNILLEPSSVASEDAHGWSEKRATSREHVYNRDAPRSEAKRRTARNRRTSDHSPNTSSESIAPVTQPILPTLQGPADLRALTEAELTVLAHEVRETIIATVSTTGGHLGSSLGVVELTIALHRLLESPRDRIVWDTGHQAYPHKLLTGRYERFATLRQLGGIGGFPRRSESIHDVFDGGHAGTGLSIGQGLATARDLRHGTERIAVVVGDAAITSGLSLEALNEIGQTVRELSQRLRASVVTFAQPGRLFEDLGITYIGLVPGHDLKALLSTFQQALELKGPVIVHVRTQKGHGFRPAETDQVGFHGAALPPMTVPPATNGNGNSHNPVTPGPT